MDNEDKWMWIPTVALILGGMIPFLFVKFVDDSWEDRPYFLMFLPMMLFTHILFKRVGRQMPIIKKWMENSLAGTTVLMFLFMFVTSGSAVLLTVLPLPHWLIFVFGICLALIATALFLNESHES